jgi:hypothetical protein
LPEKNGQTKPIWDYELDILKLLEEDNVRYLWIKKCTGAGASEFFLRYLAWKAVHDNAWQGKNVVIVTGPRLEISITLIKRLRALFSDFVTFNERETIATINNVTFCAYPSNHTDSARGLTNVAAVLLDEADFFQPGEQANARDVAERYISKSNPLIIWISTPNRPDGLFARMEAESPSMYTKIFWDWRVCVGKMFSMQEIEQAKKAPGFEREMNLSYGGLLGNAFSQTAIQAAVDSFTNQVYDYEHAAPDSQEYRKRYASIASLGVDPGYSSSRFAICLTQLRHNKIVVVRAEQYERAEFANMVTKVANIAQSYEEIRVYVDGSQPEYIRALKQRLGERTDYDSFIARKRQELHLPPRKELTCENYMKIIPVNFINTHENMLSKLRAFLEAGMIVIPADFKELIISLQTAVVDEDKLQKDQTTYDDMLDALRLSLQRYAMPPAQQQQRRGGEEENGQILRQMR